MFVKVDYMQMMMSKIRSKGKPQMLFEIFAIVD